MSHVGRIGRLEMVFASKNGKTILEDVYCEIPFKITKLHYIPNSPLARLILMSPTAGLFGGDQLDLSILVRSGAKIWISTQGSQKLHPSQKKVAEQRIQLNVEDGGELHFHCDPMIPFAGAALKQELDIDLGEKSHFSYWDALMSGRVHHGERWQFEKISTELRVRIDKNLNYLERYSLSPKQDSLESSMIMDHFNYVGTSLAYHSALDEKYLENVRSIFTNNSGQQAGVDMPFEHCLTLKIIDKEGASFQKSRQAYCETIVQKYSEGYTNQGLGF